MTWFRRLRLKYARQTADEFIAMADVRLAPPLQRLTSPPEGAPVPPPPPPAVVVAAPRLSPPPIPHRDPSTGSIPAVSFQDLLGTKTETRPVKRKKKKRGKKLFTFLIFVGLVGGVGYHFRNAEAVQHVLGHKSAAAPLPAQPFVRPTVTSAEFAVTLSAVQNGVPNNVTTKVRADYVTGTNETIVDSQIGGAFTTSKEIRTTDYLFHPGDPAETTWGRQPRTPETPTTYDAATFIPMVNDIIDQPLRDNLKPTASTSEKVGDATISSVTYVIDRARVPEVAPAIYARVPWLFDVPNATTLTAVISYDESGLIRHLDFRVDPPQPGTGSDATWVTSYTLDVSSLNSPVAITVPVDAVDIPAPTP